MKSVAVPIGSIAPGFTLATADGTPVRLDQFRDRPLMLVFYRGHW